MNPDVLNRQLCCHCKGYLSKIMSSCSPIPHGQQAIILLTHSCHLQYFSFFSLLVYAIKDEQWYEFCEKFLKDASAGGTPIDKNTFLTTVKNPVTKKFEQLEFDASQFKHDHHSGVSHGDSCEPS